MDTDIIISIVIVVVGVILLALFAYVIAPK